MYRHTIGLLFALALTAAPVFSLASVARAGAIANHDDGVLLADRRDSDRLEDEIRERREEIRRRERLERNDRERCDNDERRDDRIGDRQNLCEGENPRDRRDTHDDDLDDVWDDIRDIFD
jgi:Skp family chaperone for outer membrane proteins